jgi:hypothetical protein
MHIIAALAGLLLLTAAGLQASPGAPKPQVAVKVEQSQKVKIEGGDFDDKLQRIAFDISVTNQSLSKPTGDLSLEIYVVGQAVTQPGRLTLLQKETDGFSLEPRATFTTQTPELQLKWDTTGAAFGDKYRGWIVFIRDAAGQVVHQSASSSFVSDPAAMAGLSVGDSFDKQGRRINAPRS